MYFVGKLDKKLYGCVTAEIETDIVIITEERITHIKERHPDDYEYFAKYIPQIIADPDYIIEANKRNTAIILKEIEDIGKKYKTVLRLKVKKDFASYKNSIISFWSVGDTTWKKTIKNKKILYIKKHK